MAQIPSFTPHDPILFRYGGESLRDRLRGLSPSDAVSALQGTGQLTKIALETLYGRDAAVKVEFIDVKRESLGFEFLPLIAVYSSPILSIFSQDGAISTIRDTLSQGIKILEFLRGRAPKSITNTGDNNISVMNDLGHHNVFHAPIYMMATGTDFGKAVRAAGKPIGRAADYLQPIKKEIEGAVIGRHNVEFMRPVEAVNEINNEFISRIILSVSSPVLDKDGKWRFILGSAPIRASVDDKDFLDRVRKGEEKFGNGDRLEVFLKIQQKNSGRKILTEYSILQVISRI